MHHLLWIGGQRLLLEIIKVLERQYGGGGRGTTNQWHNSRDWLLLFPLSPFTDEFGFAFRCCGFGVFCGCRSGALWFSHPGSGARLLALVLFTQVGIQAFTRLVTLHCNTAWFKHHGLRIWQKPDTLGGPHNILGWVCSARYWKPLPSFRPQHAIFRALSQTWLSKYLFQTVLYLVSILTDRLV